MDDREQIIDCYETMYDCMIRKDTEGLKEVLDESYVLVHMTGVRMNRQEYLDALLDGTLNYYRCEHEHEPVVINGEKASGSGHVWRLRLDCTFVRREGGWKMTKSVASTY